MKSKRILPTKKDYVWVHWTPAEIGKLPERLLSEKRKAYETIKSIPKEERTFENTIYAIEISDRELGKTLQVLHLLASVSPKKTVRAEANKTLLKIEQELIDIEHDSEMYRSVIEYAKKKGKKETLSDPAKKLLEDTLRGYRRMGFELPEKDQRRLKDVFRKMNKYAKEFEERLNEYEDSIFVTKEELTGLPENYIQSLQKKNGKYKVTLAYPDYYPFMQKAENEKKRKELCEKFWKKGGEKNLELLRKLVELRREVAKILGYKTYADYKTEVKMVKTGERALEFVNDLLSQLKEKAKADIKAMVGRKKKDLGRGTKFEMHDIAYYSEKLKNEKYKVDTEELREYFPLEKVKAGTLAIYEKLFGVRMKKMSGQELWHSDVEMYEVKDKTGASIAHFFMDLYPRQGKYGHAAAFPIDTGYKTGLEKEAKYRAPSACLVTNFPKPSKNNPSLLSHGEVDTFFHEFGHVMHDVLTTAEFASQSGFSVAWDFVEAPSQMLENWVWEKEILGGYLSAHYKTGKPLPEEAMENLILSKKHNICLSSTQQLTYALYDLTLHTQNVRDLNALFNQLMKKNLLITPSKGGKFPAGFGHLAGGYDAGYYGYMYSLVFASDMYSRFKKEGILNAKTGKSYRECILEMGSSKDEIKLVQDFLARKPNNKAFLRQIGVG